MAKDNEQRPRPPVAPAQPMAPQEQPFPPGTVARLHMDKPLREADLDDIEKEALRKAGWQEGNPVPDLTQTQMAKGIQEKIEKFRTQQDGVGDMTPVPLDTPPITMPEPVDIADLPIDQQQEIQAAVVQAKAFDQQYQQEAQSENIMTVPGMAEAYQVANQSDGPQVVDDMPARPTRAAEPPSSDGFDPTLEAQEAAATQQGKAQADKAQEPDTADDTAGGTLDAAIANCPKCNHHLATPVIEFDATDKLVYMQHIEGAARFEKEYSLFGGRVIVRFRNLTTAESDLIMDQTDEDVRSGRLVHVSYVRRLEDYRMAAAVSQIRMAGNRSFTLPPVTEVKYADDEKSALPQIYRWLSTEVLTTEHLRRAVGMSWLRFQAVLNLLDSRSEDADFWPPIEQPA